MKKIVVGLLSILLAIGCVDEDKVSLVECGTDLRIQVQYTHNEDHVDKLPQEVGGIRVYIFNSETGVLTAITSASRRDFVGGTFAVPYLPNGRYTFVAWGSNSDEITQTGFFDSHMADPSADDYSQEVKVGVTTLKDFRLVLEHKDLPQEVEGDVIPATDFDDLFFAMAQDVAISAGAAPPLTFDFICNTSMLKVSVMGIDVLPPISRASADPPLQVFVVGRNGRYCYDGSIGEYAKKVRYESSKHLTTDETMYTDMKILRLDLNRHTPQDPVLLYVRHAVTGKDLIAPLDIVAALCQVKDEQGNYRYQTQDDFDDATEFPIEVMIHADLSVSIIIDGFEIVPLDPVADRP